MIYLLLSVWLGIKLCSQHSDEEIVSSLSTSVASWYVLLCEKGAVSLLSEVQMMPKMIFHNTFPNYKKNFFSYKDLGTHNKQWLFFKSKLNKIIWNFVLLVYFIWFHNRMGFSSQSPPLTTVTSPMHSTHKHIHTLQTWAEITQRSLM